MSVQKTIQQKLSSPGKGETKQHAFASALAEIQNKIMEQSKRIIANRTSQCGYFKGGRKQIHRTLSIFLLPTATYQL